MVNDVRYGIVNMYIIRFITPFFIDVCFIAVHEKIFVVFMITSIAYELITLVVFKWAHPYMKQQPQVSHLCYYLWLSVCAMPYTTVLSI